MVVHRISGQDHPEYLVLHRAERGAAYAGDWAWTPPSGARLPGEPVVCGAARELAEETGIAVVQLRPVDLSGQWAVFAAEVVGDTQVRLDAEHDRFAWLPAAEAARCCLPDTVAASLRQVAAMPAPRISFRPLSRQDLPDMVAWLHAPHAARWFYQDQDLDLPAAERKYGPRIGGSSPTRAHVVLISGQACGFIQHYHVRDYPDYHAATGGIDAIGIDYLIGVPQLTGHGLGPQMIWSYLQQEVFPAWPGVPFVLASPEVANQQSIRALEKAGFVRTREIAGHRHDKPELLCTLDRVRIFGDLGWLDPPGTT